MLPTQTAYAESYSDSPYLAPAPRVALGTELRLSSISAVIGAIDRILPSQPTRIELDASRLKFMTEAARRMLVVATHRLAQRDIDLVVVGCDPF